MKKLNLLVIALLFTMTAKADSSTAATSETSSILKEFCKPRKNFIKCVEKSTNTDNFYSCELSYVQSLEKKIKKHKVTYEELFDYKMGDTEGKFLYSIGFNNGYVFHASFPIQVDPSCNKASELEISNPSHFKHLKMCLVVMTNTMSKLQDCN